MLRFSLWCIRVYCVECVELMLEIMFNHVTCVVWLCVCLQVCELL